MKYIFSLLILILLHSCYYDNADELNPGTEPCDTPGVLSFSPDTLRLLRRSSRSQSEGSGASTGSQSNYGLDSYSSVISTINSSGTFIKTITHDPTISSSKWMPLNSNAKISECNIQKIHAWLNRGLPNN